MLQFESDYMEGAHPKLLEALIRVNTEKTTGYGQDDHCFRAEKKILDACGCPEGRVFFLIGGTQANSTVIDSLLMPYEGVFAADTGHINTHEAGAVEMNGHKVLTIPHRDGKITPENLRAAIDMYLNDTSRDHIVKPGMVYLSHPSEFGTLYSLDELTAISALCRDNGLKLYLDGARLAYALASPKSDVGLKDLARLCDCFYIGGTKCGALLGEAVVFPSGDISGHFFTLMKRHGAVLAKGKTLGVQFDALFTDGLYLEVGSAAVSGAQRVLQAVQKRGWTLLCPADANQVFFRLPNADLKKLTSAASVTLWEKGNEESVVRITCSWSASEEDIEALVRLIETI